MASAPDILSLSPTELIRMVNSTRLGPVIDYTRLQADMNRAGLRAGDLKHVHLVKYTRWLLGEYAQRQATAAETPAAATLVRKEKAAEIFDVGPRTVLAWAHDGCPHEKRKGAFHFDPPAVQAWLDETQRPLRPGRPPATADPAMASAKLEKEQALAGIYKLRLARDRADVIDADEVETDRVQRILAVKGALLDHVHATPAEADGEGMLQPGMRPALEALIRHRINAILERFSRP